MAARSLAPFVVVLPLVGFAACSSSPKNNASGTTSASSSSGPTSTSAGSSSSSSGTGGGGPVAMHSSSIAVSPDGSTIYVVNADVDSVSVIDTATQKLTKEIALGSGPPTVDGTGHYTPNVGPRALALSPQRNLLYVSGERTSSLYAIDLASGTIKTTVSIGSEPIGVLLSPDESTVYVACSNEGTVVKIDAATAKVTATATITDGTSPLGFPIQSQPWALGWSLDYSTLYVTHLIAPNVSAIDAGTFAVKATINIPDVPTPSNKLIANGQARGLYDVVARPGTSGEVWVPHLMLAVGTPETTDVKTTLDFDSTAFPTVSVFTNDTFNQRLTTQSTVATDHGQFGDVVSGPHAIAFTADGAYALVVDSASEDVLVIDANGKLETQLVRPLYPTGGNAGHMLEGIVISPDGKTAYVDQRNTSDVAVVAIDTSNGIHLTVPGPAIPRLSGADPMPAQYRTGQMLFNTADSESVKITSNSWIACATCHVEGRSDAVTWKFLEGPRDTPTNAGGKSDTGFELRTADRVNVFDYWLTIEREQGGDFGGSVTDAGVAIPPTDPTIVGFLDAIQAYVNFAIPAPIPPHTDATLVAQGKAIFEGAAGCSGCHSGPAYTDSCAGAGLGTDAGCDLSKADPSLYDVGTCVTTGFPDVAHYADNGELRAACKFNVPSLRGLASTPPYLHDGSAATLHDLIAFTQSGKINMGSTKNLSAAEVDALVEFLRSL